MMIHQRSAGAAASAAGQQRAPAPHPASGLLLPRPPHQRLPHHAKAMPTTSTPIACCPASRGSSACAPAPGRARLQPPSAAAAPSPSTSDYRSRPPQDVRVLVVGCTGYIGKFVTKELARRGYNVVAFTREKAGISGKMGKEDIKKVGTRAAAWLRVRAR